MSGENQPIVDYRNTGDIALKNQNTLRKIVGALGMLLPLLLFLFLWADSGFNTILPSISHYYYTRASGIFLIVLSMLSVFLLIYKGEEIQDFYASVIAGTSSLLLLLFPTGNLDIKGYETFWPVSVTHLNTCAFREGFHYFSAGVFLLTLAYMSAFLFTKSNVAPSKRTDMKIVRNRIYRVCAALIVIAIAFVAVSAKFLPEFHEKYCITFWMEVIAVEAFGFSWLTKGKAILEDK